MHEVVFVHPQRRASHIKDEFPNIWVKGTLQFRIRNVNHFYGLNMTGPLEPGSILTRVEVNPGSLQPRFSSTRNDIGSPEPRLRLTRVAVNPG